MDAGGKLEVEIEVKSSADKSWGSLRDSTTLFPKALSHDCNSIEVLEGDGKATACVCLITYAEGSPILKVSTEKIKHVDEANKMVTYMVIDWDLSKYYKCILGMQSEKSSTFSTLRLHVIHIIISM